LWNNTIGYLEGTNIDRIKDYGGRAKRGVLLTGAPRQRQDDGLPLDLGSVPAAALGVSPGHARQLSPGPGT